MASTTHAQAAEAHGVPVRWVESGDVLPVVFILGIPTSPALWRHVLPLVDRVRCLAFEMVGYGESIPAGAGRDISVGAQAGYLLDWLEYLGIDRAVLVGHDLGGGVAQIAAVRRPQGCAGLLLTNAVGYDSWPIPSVKALRAVAPLVDRILRPLIGPSLAPLILRGHDDLGRAREALAVHAAPYARHGGGHGLARQLVSLDVTDTLAVQDRLPAFAGARPGGVGTGDQFQKLHYGERFAADLHTIVCRIDGGKHFTPEDHPDVLAEQIDSLVAEVAR